MSKTIVIIGASGNVGAATVSELSTRYGATHRIVAGIRDAKSAKAQELAKLPGVTVVGADPGQPATLTAAFAHGADAVFVVVASHIDRTKLAAATIAAAKDAKAQHIVVVSLSLGEDTIFGRQFGPIEAKTKASGIPYTILRLAMFLDNIWVSRDSIINQNAFYGSQRGDARQVSIAVQDIADAASTILVRPAAHVGKTYHLTSKVHTNDETAAALSKALGREIKYVSVPPEGSKQALLGIGFPEWQVDGINEFSKAINDGSPSTTVATDDFRKITHREPTTVEQWARRVAPGFGAAPVEQKGKFGGQVVVVLGATGAVGSGAVYSFLERGATVVAVGREQKKLDALVVEVGKLAPRLLTVVGDVGSEAQALALKSAVDLALPAGGKIHHVVASVGNARITPQGPVGTPLSELVLSFEQGLYLNIYTAKAFLPALQDVPSSSFTMLSGGLAYFCPYPGLWAGSIKNAATNALTLGLASEFKDSGVRINTVCLQYSVCRPGESKNSLGMPSVGGSNRTFGTVIVGLVASGKRGEVFNSTASDEAQTVALRAAAGEPTFTS